MEVKKRLINRREELYKLFAYLKRKNVLMPFLEEKAEIMRCHICQVPKNMLTTIPREKYDYTYGLLGMFRSPKVSFIFSRTKREDFWYKVTEEIERELGMRDEKMAEEE